MSDIESVLQIRQRILERYQSDPKIHLNVSLKSPKLELKNVEAEITGVYRYIFQIEEETSGEKKRHTLQYADVLLHSIEILELEQGK